MSDNTGELIKCPNCGTEIDIRQTLEKQVEEELEQRLETERKKIESQAENQSEMRIRELEKRLLDQKKLVEILQKKQNQIPNQLRGEVQEEAIEDWLNAKFPEDDIIEVKKGVRGGDVIQIVFSETSVKCGKIYYESKRTKTFQNQWVDKFKKDIAEEGANIGVLVTESMPKDMERMGVRDGVWICDFNEFKALSFVLRQSLIKISEAQVFQENKGDKMHLLYDYLTGNTFRMQIEAIVEGFTKLRSDLEREKKSFQRIWKQREAQIEKVTANTISMYSNIKGIAGNAIKEVRELNSPDDGYDLLDS